ncbi:MAG: hypothetical protein JNJ58_13760 [Chitinophagaceae bacterium]|nr:hypothetical protein [Chitinophagaceae bacterium]
MKNLFSILAAGIILVLSACEGVTYYDHFIDNQSSNYLTVIPIKTIGGYIDTIYIAPGETKGIQHSKKPEGDAHFVNPVIFFDTVYVKTGLLTLTKNIMSADQWDIQSSRNRTTHRHVYNFTLRDTDFQ